MFINIGNAKVYSTSFGLKSNPAILGIGGWIGSWELWAEPFSALSQNWHTIAYDHRGTGATFAPPESITFDRLVQDVFAVMDAYDIQSCVLAAESAGALTALAAALQNPQRISGLVIVDGMTFRSTSREKDPFLIGLQQAYPATLGHFVNACLPDADSEHIRRWGRKIIDRASQEAAIVLYGTASEVDLRSELGGIGQPTLIFHGEADAIVPLAEALELAELIPNAKLVVLKGAGHVPTLTHPNEIAQGINATFLA